MRRTKINVLDRVLAIMLSVMLIVAMLPQTTLKTMAATANHPDTFTISVTDGTNPLVGATVALSAVEPEWSLTLSGDTDEYGVASFATADIQQALTAGSLTEGTISYTVTLENYDEVTGTVQVTDDNLVLNTDVTMSETVTPQPDTYTLSVTVSSGDATVVLNGVEQSSITVDEGTEVPILITPAEGSYIKTITVAGETKEVTKGEAYSGTITVDADIAIVLEVVKEYTVTVTDATEGGSITLNGENNTSVTVDENSTVALNVDAADGYQISSVSIGGVAQTIDNVDIFNANITVTDNVDVTVVFVKVYTITITHTGNGTVVTEPSTSGGNVVVEEGENITITADPDDNYRVSEVVINNEADTSVTGENYSDTDTYVKNLTADKDYTITITFAPNRYKVTAEDTTNGSISLGSELVDYDGSCMVTVTPNDGYSISGVQVDGTDIVNYSEDENGVITFTVENITADKLITATFVATSTISSEIAELFNDEDALRIDGTTFIYANNGVITFVTDKTGIRIYDENGDDVAGGKTTQTFTLDESVTITKIQLRYKADGEWTKKWHDLEGVSESAPIKLVVDKSETDSEVVPDEKHSEDFYNTNFNVSISVEDKGDYSGIAGVEYFVTDSEIEANVTYEAVSDDLKTQAGTLYTHTDTVNNVTSGSVSVIVADTKNNSDFVTVWFKVTDLAGNVEYVRTENYMVNCTAPTLDSVTIDGTLHEDATAGHYNDKRVATIVITDRASSFDSAKATEGIVIVAKDANGDVVTISKPSMVVWNSSDDVHTATVTFETDANYTWEISYTNKAGKMMDKSSVVETGDNIYSFAVDKTAPSAEISFSIDDTWDRLLSTLTFGVWDKYSITATATATDEISDVYDILYYKSNDVTALNETALEALYEAGEFGEDTYTVTADERFVVYARITDYAGNTLYISTDGAIVDTTDSVITLNPAQANGAGFYNGDVKVDIVVSDLVEGKDVYSGIKSIDYKVIDMGKGSKVTQSGNLYTFEVENPTYEQLKADWTGDITVKAGNGEGQNNSDNVKVIVTVVDNAGNEYSEETMLAINVDTLSASISMDGTAGKVVDGYGYFAMDKRTATITLNDRASSFDKNAARAGIVVNAYDKDGNTVENAYVISEWTSVGDVHTATVTFNEDAKYEWSFAYTNKAGNTLNTISTGDVVSVYEFAVDNTDPTGTVTVNENTWDKILNVLTFGLYSNVKADITATSDDNLCPVEVEYYKTNNPIAMTEAELDRAEFISYEDFSIETDEQFVIYLKITDYAGNYIYINSNGYVVDKNPTNITLTQSEDDALYNKNSEVKVSVVTEDDGPYSGIKTIDYWIEKNGVKTKEGNLYTFNVETPTQADLKSSWSGNIEVDKALNNGCDVTVYVKVVDNAGNENVESIDMDIDATSPSINVTFDNGNDNNGNTYFDDKRVATVVITERVHHFEADKATAGIVVNAVDAEGKVVENAFTISNWTTVDNSENPDLATHTATITFNKDANYTWSITYTDKAGNANSAVTTSVTNGTSIAAFDFTVDTTKPTGSITAVSAEGREVTWSELRNELTFGFWSKDKITLSGKFDDLTSSPLTKVEYYKVKSTSASDGTKALTTAELDAVTSWNALTAKSLSANGETYYTFDGLSVTSDEQFVVYVRLTDLAGNYTYISTNGLIVDHTAPLEETIAPEVTITPEQPINGIYNGDVKVDIKVVDTLVGGTYAGLKTVSYKVFNMGTETQSGDLFTFNVTDPKQSELVQTWTGSITVDSELNNSNDVKIVIYAQDNSLNASEDDVTIKIDTTAPVINVSYDNNVADNDKYFKENRTATIVVTERNFNAADVKLTITNTDGVIPTVSEWSTVEGTGNKDNTTWSATIVYSADGDYTFDVAYKDLAGNACTSVSYGNSVAPVEFTIDKTLPVISVSYDNNAVSNDKYFAAERTATVVINEHNFDVNRVIFTQTATLNGTNITIPTVSWNNNGDVHTATIVYSADGDYTFDVVMTDMAGNESGEANYGNSVAGKDFVVDKTITKPVVGGVENGKAYTGDVIPTISFNDVNYASYEVSLLRTRMGDKNIDVTEEFIESVTEQAQGGEGSYDTFESVVENDGIYTLTVKVVDKAGNEEVETITFTVNRFGSVYSYSDYLVSLIKDGGQYITIKDGESQAITDDLVITEYNAEKLLADSLKILITRDGKAIEADYTTNPVDINTEVTLGESGWYEYVYTIKASNFAEDGEYKISLTSAYGAADSENNESTSVPENSQDEAGNQIVDTMKFMVDTTAPEIRNIVNLDERIPDVEKIGDNGLEVEYTLLDVGGLKSVEIIVNGESRPLITEFDDAFNYSGSFFIEESDDTAAQTVRIIVTDLAGNVTDTSADDFDTKDLYVFSNEVVVSRNFFVRWYANAALFWGTIGGTVAVLGGAGAFITVRRKKKLAK